MVLDGGHRLSRPDLSVEQKDSVASLTSSEENLLRGGRAEVTTEEKWIGGRLRRLTQKETRDGGTEGYSMRSEAIEIMCKEVQRFGSLWLSVAQFQL